MGIAELVTLIVQILVAVGGLAGIGALLMVSAQKRKLVADTGKTDAEAENVLADAQAKRTAREVSLIEPYERVQTRMQQELEEAYEELDWMRDYLHMLTNALRQAGIDVPPEPIRPWRQRHRQDVGRQVLRPLQNEA